MISLGYILYNGKTYPVAAKVRSNGIDCVAIQLAPGRPKLIALAVARAAPGRSRPVLVTVDGERIV